jgi:hypothetical protein
MYYVIYLRRSSPNQIMALELIPYPISIIFAVVFIFAWNAILWKIRKKSKIYNAIFYASIAVGAILLISLVFSL